MILVMKIKPDIYKLQMNRFFSSTFQLKPNFCIVLFKNWINWFELYI